jgi:periplasmic protein CpxP/Spy
MSQNLSGRAAVVPRGGRGAKLMLMGLLIAASSAVALSAWAQPGPGGHGGPGMAWGGPMGGPMMGGHGMDRMLTDVGASDAQKTQIRQIMKSAFDDLRAQREQNRGLHDKAMEVFTAPNVDANAAEAVRQQMLQQHDQSSKRMMQAMLEVSRVLTPEQRAKMAERMKLRAEHMRQRMQDRPGAASAPK